MKIVFFHAGLLPVKKYGGIERLIYWHMIELVKQGHHVTLIGHPNSQVEDKGIKLIPYNPKKDPDFENYIPDHSDIIHLACNYKMRTNIPTLITIHGNGQIGEVFHPNTVFVSKNHATNHGSKQFIYNALDFTEYPYEGPQKDKKNSWKKFLFLAKASWKVKNLKHCVNAAKKTKKHLHILGGRSFWPSQFIHNYGIVGGTLKLETMKQCDALLFPVRWHEPFGLAMIEAMAMGLPVIGSSFGSLPEILSPRVGILCKNYDEFQNVLNSSRPSFLNADEIRSYVEERFSIKTYTSQYIELYGQVLKGLSLSPNPPTLLSKKSPQDLLPF
jgi:glycosyltransferase involved in cell wall biosynthesis